ncbi:hypothetical protein MN116_001754 [Schistosoma mekongi]|uniref:PLOD1-3-like GT domain-containing protein n=1 Tax=Schistosoma mekongi TaxID=38744 RepID=A0AAE1ZIS5_SCHME|nr:hypothetical protein MN116_001754 [Schistosoma mekongi]
MYVYLTKVLGEGSYWKGGYVAKSTGGGQKINLLKDELSKGTYRPDQLVLFVDRVQHNSLYPEVKPGEKRYLNSGGFIGSVANLIKIVNHTHIKDDDDDQLYYTNIFLDPKLRNIDSGTLL